MNSEDVAEELQNILGCVGQWGVRRLGNYLLIDIKEGDADALSFTIHIQQMDDAK
jgi:hypothetical protein